MTLNKPLNNSLIAETHPSYYSMHKYWSRKPSNVVRSYIEHFTNPGEIVADPFLGSGVTFIESIRSNRSAIGIDINPMSKLITKATLLSFSEEEASRNFEIIKEAFNNKIGDLFYTKNDGKKHYITHVVWESTTDCPNCGKTIELFTAEKKGNRKFLCNNCKNYSTITSSMVSGEIMREIWYVNDHGDKKIKSPSKDDLSKIAEIEDYNYKIKLKTDFMFRNKRTLVHDGMNLKNLFTKRNLIALSLINESINKIKKTEVRQLFNFIFTGSVAQGSRLIAYRGGLKSGGPAWTVSGFWVPKKHFEINPWDSFRNRYRRVINAKRKFSIENPDLSFTLIDSLKNSIYSTKTFGYLKTGSATKLSKYISKASVDYIFTDPPYGDSVPYLEYSTLWNNWIHEKIKSEDEIIISDSDVRTKDILSYTTGLKESMLECYRVLKKGKWISITFNNRNFDVWKSLINSINEAGFEIINAIYQVPAVIPAKSQLSKSGSGVGDLIINARKPTKKKQKGRKLSKKQFEKTVLKIADKCIGERNGVASTDQINRSVMLELIGKGVVDFKNDDLTKIMRKKFHSNKGFWAHKNTYRKENYDQIDDSIKSITSKCLSNGISDRKKIIQKVFNELTGSRTPDISEINLIIDSALRSGNTLNLFS